MKRQQSQIPNRKSKKLFQVNFDTSVFFLILVIIIIIIINIIDFLIQGLAV